MESKETATAEQRWFANSTAIALLSLVIFVLTGIVSLGGYFLNKQDEREKRSIMEVDRLHDPPFSVSLSKVLNHGFDFIDKEKGNVRRDPKVRVEDFWATATDTDADMLLIVSRMKSSEQCLNTRDCDRDEVFSRLPETIYQAIFFLRDCVFVNPKLEAESQGPRLE